MSLGQDAVLYTSVSIVLFSTIILFYFVINVLFSVLRLQRENHDFQKTADGLLAGQNRIHRRRFSESLELHLYQLSTAAFSMDI